MSSRKISVCIAVLNWNGFHHVKTLLPSLVKAAAFYTAPCPIIILDNCSEDFDLDWINTKYPDVEVVLSEKNDFLFSYNKLLANRFEDIVILLNNDLKVDENFIKPLLEHFLDTDVFSVTSKAYDWDGVNVVSGPSTLYRHRRGWYYVVDDLTKQQTCYTLYACGGYVAVDRKKFLKIGGFDRLFFPMYGEDLDLCYKAWCHNWTSIYEPKSIVYHRVNGSSGSERAARLSVRAQFLFQWRHFRKWSFRLNHFIYAHWLWLIKWAKKDKVWLEEFSEAKKIWKLKKKNIFRNNCLPTADLQYISETCGKVF